MVNKVDKDIEDQAEGGALAPTSPTEVTAILSETEKAAGIALTTDGETGSGAKVEEREGGPLQLQVEFVTELDNLRITEGGAVEVGIDDENFTQGGQIETRSLASCVGYALCLPDKAYVGHLNFIPDKLMWEDLEDRDELWKAGFNGQLKIFIFGGDGGPIADEIVKVLCEKLCSLIPGLDPRPIQSSPTLTPLFCDISPELYRQLSGTQVIAKAKGICIDTRIDKVRLFIEKDPKTIQHHQDLLDEIYGSAKF